MTLTGTLAEINATLGAVNNVVYRGAQDFFGDDALTVVTNDGGNGGSAPLIDADQVTIHLNTHLTGTPSDDTYTALPGNERIDAHGGNDTVKFGFKLTEATFTWAGTELTVDGPASHTILTGFETFVFTDGTVQQRDGDALVDDLFYYAQNHDVWNAQADADAAFSCVWLEGGARSERLLRHRPLSRALSGRESVGRRSAAALRPERLEDRPGPVVRLRSRGLSRGQSRREAPQASIRCGISSSSAGRKAARRRR